MEACSRYEPGHRAAIFACTVVSEPSWPVFGPHMSKASSPRTSPTMCGRDACTID